MSVCAHAITENIQYNIYIHNVLHLFIEIKKSTCLKVTESDWFTHVMLSKPIQLIMINIRERERKGKRGNKTQRDTERVLHSIAKGCASRHLK